VAPNASPDGDHAGQMETFRVMYYRPDLVKLDSAGNESAAAARLSLPDVYTPIWWYARFPNHYDGDGAKATMELGN